MYKNHKLTALLPMKGHSERVPNKNMRNFCGEPLFYKILHELMKVEYIDEIIVDTDGDEIKKALKNDFPSVIIKERREELKGDYVSMNRVIADDMDFTESNFILQTHSTNPLLRSNTIYKAIISYFEKLSIYDSLFSVTKYQARLYRGDGTAVNHNPQELIRTQDLEPLYEENSNIYIFSKDSFKNNGMKRIGGNPQMFVVPQIEAMDIDNEDDFIIAEQIYMYKHHK